MDPKYKRGQTVEYAHWHGFHSDTGQIIDEPIPSYGGWAYYVKSGVGVVRVEEGQIQLVKSWPHPAPICAWCSYFTKNIGNGGTCKAFPQGIPDDIWNNKVDHRKPYDGDNGVRFATKVPKGLQYADSIFGPMHVGDDAHSGPIPDDQQQQTQPPQHVGDQQQQPPQQQQAGKNT